MNPVPDMDGRLYFAILRSQGHWADNLYDLKKIKILKEFSQSIDPYYERPWGRLAPGNFFAIGHMENLHTLMFDCAVQVNDFSFLSKCRKLKKLDLRNTNFSDCALLSGLTNLKQVLLPPRAELEHMEVLDTLSCQVYTNDPVDLLWYDNYELLPVQEVPPPPAGKFSIRFLGFDAREYTNSEITQEVLDELAGMIRKGPFGSLYMSMDEYGEDGDFLSIDLENGWAAVCFNYWDEEGDAHMCLPFNGKYNEVDELAPVQIGRQTPVPKCFALDDLNLAAECALYFAGTGALYPGIRWVKFE